MSTRSLPGIGGLPVVDSARAPGLYVLAGAYLLASVSLSLHFFQGMKANLVLIAIMMALVVRTIAASDTQLLGHDWAYLFYFSFAILSGIWSVSPQATLEQALPMIVPWLVTFLLCGISADWVCRFVVMAALVSATLSILMVSISRRLAFQPVSSSGAPELRGIFAHQLFLGSFIIITLGLIAVSYANGDINKVFGRSRAVAVAAVILLVVALYLSRTRLYIGVGILAFALTWLLSRTSSRRWIVVNVIAIATVTLALASGKIITYLQARNFDLTFTGRTDIWEKTLSATDGGTGALGFGFGSFQLPEFDYLFGNFRPTHAHNSFIQAYFEIGAIGLVVLILLALTQLIAAWRYSLTSNRYSYSLFLVLFSIFGSLTGGGIYAGFLTTPLCLMMLFLSMETRKQPCNTHAQNSVP